MKKIKESNDIFFVHSILEDVSEFNRVKIEIWIEKSECHRICCVSEFQLKIYAMNRNSWQAIIFLCLIYRTALCSISFT